MAAEVDGEADEGVGVALDLDGVLCFEEGDEVVELLVSGVLDEEVVDDGAEADVVAGVGGFVEAGGGGLDVAVGG